MPSGGRGLRPRGPGVHTRLQQVQAGDRPHGRGRGYRSHGSPPTKSSAKPQTAPPSGRTTDRSPHGRAQEHHRHHRQPLHGNKDPAIIETIAAQLETPRLQRWPAESDQKASGHDWAVIEALLPDTSTLSDETSTMANSHTFTATTHAEKRLCELVRVIGSRWPIEECLRPPSRKRVWRNTSSGFTAPGTATSPWRCSPWLFLAVLRHTAARGPAPVDNRQRPAAHTRTDRNIVSPGPAPQRPVRRLISLSIAEIRRLFDLIDKDDHAVELGPTGPFSAGPSS